MSDYKSMIDVFKTYFKTQKKISILELTQLKELRGFKAEKIIALIKLLIGYDKLRIVDSEDKKFQDYVIEWNPRKELRELPVIKEMEFSDVDLCVTLPPFDKFGLSDYYKGQGIKIKTLKDEFSFLFSKARNSIKICSPFFEFNGFEYFKDILLTRAQNKVKIEILSRQINLVEKNSRFTDMQKVYDIFKNRELEESLEIRNYYFSTKDSRLASSIHAKIIIVDDKMAYIGSGEVRKNSFEKNFELGFTVSGEKVNEIAIIFDSIFKRSEVIIFE